MDPTLLQAALLLALAGTTDPTLLRVVVHERTDRGYRSLTTVDAGAGQPGGLDWASTPSHTAWRALVERRAPVVVEATFGRVDHLDAAGRRVGGSDGRELSERSTTLLRERGATHVLAAPILEGGGLSGMVCVELRWSGPDDPPLALWPRLLAALDRRAPSPPSPRSAARITDDPLLPVVGPATEALVAALRRFAARTDTILLRGPTGVGKTRLAEWCHASSSRAGGPFITANLNALPRDLFEGELFGWRRGAHSQATSDHVGLVASAERGTLFLDEIDKLDLGGQHKLLQLLESNEYRPLGERRTLRADVRFIVATNADLERARAEGRFREDLYWRISVLPVDVPPLDDRRDEIPLWADRFAADAEATLDPAARPALGRRAWPGNLRQLDRFLRRAAALADPGGDGRPRIDLAAIERASATERPATDDLVARLEQVAELLAARVVGEGGEGLVLEDLSLLRGLVLDAAARRMPQADLYRALGEHRLVDTRNHQAAFRRDVARARQALDKLRR